MPISSKKTVLPLKIKINLLTPVSRDDDRLRSLKHNYFKKKKKQILKPKPKYFLHQTVLPHFKTQMHLILTTQMTSRNNSNEFSHSYYRNYRNGHIQLNSKKDQILPIFINYWQPQLDFNV